MNESRALLLLLAIVLIIPGCAEPTEQEVVTETIQPASPPPGDPGEDAVVLTQTTEIGDERSPNEGGILTNPSGAEFNGPQPVTRGSAPPASATQPPPSPRPRQ